MKIKYNSASPKAGTIEHIQPNIAATLIAAGFAEAVPLPKRGSADWLKARLEQSALVTHADVHDTAVEVVVGVRWEAISLPITGKPAILRRSGCEVTRFEVPPKECPKNVVKQFNDLEAVNVGAGAEILAAARRSQAEYDEKIKTAKRW